MLHQFNHQSNFSGYILLFIYLLFIIIITTLDAFISHDTSIQHDDMHRDSIHEYSMIDHSSSRVLFDSRPFIAIFIQIGQFIHWPALSDCIDNIITAKSFNTDVKYFNLTTYHHNHNNNNNQDHYNHHHHHTSLSLLNNFNLDLYISLNYGIDIKHRNIIINEINLYKINHTINEIIITTVKNTGLDFKPFLEQISKAQNNRNYDYILKLHSKSNKQWLTHSLQCLCGTSIQVLSILNHFSNNDKVDIYCDDSDDNDYSDDVDDDDYSDDVDVDDDDDDDDD